MPNHPDLEPGPPVVALRNIGYFLSAALLAPFLVPLIGGLGSQNVPFGSLRWRFGFSGLVFGSLGYLLLSYLAAVMSAAWSGKRRTLLTLGVLSAVITVLLLAAAGVFTLDFLQLRPLVAPAARHAFTSASVKAVCQGAMGLVTFALLSRSSLRSGWALERRSRVGQ